MDGIDGFDGAVDLVFAVLFTGQHVGEGGYSLFG